MRLLALAVLLFIIDWFAFQAVSYLLQDANPLLMNLVVAGFWSVPVISIIYTFLADRGWTTTWPRSVKVIFTSLIFILYFSKLLMGTVIAIDDLRRGIAWLIGSLVPETGFSAARMPFMSKLGFAIGLIPLLSLTYGLIRNPYRYKVFRKDILLPDIPDTMDGLRLVQISDIHAGSFLAKDRVRKSVEMINALDPDFVFFTGDLVNNSAHEVDAYIDTFREIKATHGIFSVFGNHDYGDYVRWSSAQAKQDNHEKLKLQHKRLGWDLLLNAHRVINVQGGKVGVIGVENYSAHPRFQKYGDMGCAMEGLEKTDLTILLSHDPSHWDDEILPRYPTIDLTLSGHTHGFQFGIELTEAIKWSPVQYMYKRWAGLYQEGHQYLYVNRGLGFLGYPGRVGILPEITLLTIRKGLVK
ncbi:MAG TPA: metallophosphoesterase [Saprospiraceae bacterium]|nr:metallophosphoesterase [Saprospiraceae bacterium]